MAFSSVFVVSGSLRLRQFQPASGHGAAGYPAQPPAHPNPGPRGRVSGSITLGKVPGRAGSATALPGDSAVR
jgi:hypothetical protein